MPPAGADLSPVWFRELELGDYEAFATELTADGLTTKQVAGMLVVQVQGADVAARVLERALAAQLSIEQVVPRHETLEDLFMREAITSGENPTS